MAKSNYTSGRAPRGAETVKGFTHKKEAGFHYIVVEKPRRNSDDPDMEQVAVEDGYFLIDEGPRKNLYRIPVKEYEAREKGYREEGNARLRAKGRLDLGKTARTESGDEVEFTEGDNRLEITAMSGSEMASTLPDN